MANGPDLSQPLSPDEIATLEAILPDTELMDEVIRAAQDDDLLSLRALIHGSPSTTTDDNLDQRRQR
jgi:hypothetical protein